jgi:hypothetical protein
MSKSNVFKWHKRFREGREDVNNDEKQSTPVTKRMDKNAMNVRELVPSDHWLTCRMNNGRSGGNIVKNWREITLKNSRLLIAAALKINV